MKTTPFFICFTLAILLVSCQSVTIRPVYEYSEVEASFEGEANGSPVPDFEKDLEFTRLGIELAMPIEQAFELFTDLNGLKARYKHESYIDGYEIGIGARSLWPTESGWGVDWSGRISNFDMDDSEGLWLSAFVNRDVSGYGIALRGGPYYAIEIGEEYLFSPHAGILYNMKRGNKELTALNTKLEDYDFESDSIGLYVGTRFNNKSLKYFDIAADLFVGSSNLVGFMLSAGIRF